MGMRAFVVTAPRVGFVTQVDPPIAGAGQVIVDIDLVGLCGTDVELFTGEMAYLAQGHARYPMRLGHEWSGTVVDIGEGVEPRWLGRRVSGDTTLPCHRCERCRRGRHHLCDDRFELGVRGGWPGALASHLVVPEPALHELPDGVDPVAGALVEPGANALRAVRAAQLGPGDRALIVGAGTIGLLAAAFAASHGAEAHIMGRAGMRLDFARSLGYARTWVAEEVAGERFTAVIDASNGSTAPSLAVDLVEPGGRIVLVGIATTPSLIDTRRLTLADVTVVGVLGGSSTMAATIASYADSSVDPRPLVAGIVGLEEVAGVLGGSRRPEWRAGPKVLVDPRR